MADQDTADLLMMFTLPGKVAISGETRTEVKLNKGDMTKGFQPGKMFEISSFKLATKLNDEDKDGADNQRQAEQQARDKQRDTQRTNDILRRAWQRHRDPKDRTSAPNQLDMPQLPMPSGSSIGSFAKWRSGTMTKPYPADIDHVSFSRTMDNASSILLQNCIQRVVYESATLIKRKAAGSVAAGEVFLRFDFDTVLMTRCDWDDDTPVKEDCEFIFRAVTIHYLPQLPNGDLGAPIQAFFTMSPGLKAYNLKGS